MIRTLTLATGLAAALSLSALAQDAKPATTPMPPAAMTTPAQPAPAGMMLTEQEGKTWIAKPVYSSDGTKLGEVVAFQRDAGNMVLAMHADIGGYFGFGQTRVKLMPAQFKLQGDRIVLGLTAAQAKDLPKVQS